MSLSLLWFPSLSSSLLIWWLPAFVGEYLPFEITELTMQMMRHTHFLCVCVPHQRLQEGAARVKKTTRSAQAPVLRPSVCVRDLGWEPAVATANRSLMGVVLVRGGAKSSA